MDIFSRGKQYVSDLTARTRQTVAFGPDHPAVRAAKRYCERTGESWEIGLGGRCELGKRALKQWWHEADWKRRGAIVALPILAFVVLCAFFSPQVTLTMLLVMSVVTYVIAGLAFGFFMGWRKDDGDAPWHDSRPWARACVAGFVFTVPIAAPVYGLDRLSRHEKAAQLMTYGFFGLIGAAALAFCAFLISRLGWFVFMMGALQVVGALLMIIGIGAGIITAVMNHQEKVHASRLADVSLQHAERDRLEPLLQACYRKACSVSESASAVSYEQWRDELEARLMRAGIGWQDVVCQHPWLLLRDVELSGPRYDRVAGSLESGLKNEWRRRQLEAATSRREQGVIGFVLATVFFAKTRVCPNVILPKWEDVTA